MQSLTIASMDNNVGELHTLTTEDTSKLQQAYTNITTAKASLASPDANRFIVSATEPTVATDGQVWIKAVPNYYIGQYITDYVIDETGADTFFVNKTLTIPVLVTTAGYTSAKLPSYKTNYLNPLVCYPGKTITNYDTYRTIYLCAYGSSIETFTGTVTMTVNGPLKITKFRAPDDENTHGSNYSMTTSYTNTVGTCSFSARYPSTWEDFDIEYEITATGTGTGSIVFSPCEDKDNYGSSSGQIQKGVFWNGHQVVGYHGMYSYAQFISDS